MRQIAFILFLSLIFSLYGCGSKEIKPQLMQSMAEFDSVYIPADVFTNLSKQRESEVAMEKLVDVWQRFKENYYQLEIKYGVNITDKFWQEDLDQIDKLILAAQTSIKEQNLTRANEQLQAIKVVFKDLRHRNGLVYFMDELNDYQLVMTGIFQTIRGKRGLKDKDLAQLEQLSDQAQLILNEAISTEVNPELFGFEEGKKEAILKRLEIQQELVANFGSAVALANYDEIFQSAQELKPNFIVLYKAFGDFQPVFDVVVKERKEQEKNRAKEAEAEVGSE
jgi:hypothetical protein